uniref:RING-type E3 ubiquitin transferase n=1 Tax=Oryza punctata TaxID=4537 RepID=A0A0E0LCA7_ORYPU
MELPWLDLPFTLLTLLLATRLAYDYYGVVAATFTGSFSLQIFLFYCFARWYRHTIAARAAAADGDGGAVADEEASPPVLTPLLEAGGGGGGGEGAGAAASSSLANRCFAVVFMVFVPLVIVVFERSQADVVAYALCLANIIVMVVWLSPDAAADPAAAAAAAKSFLRLSDDEDEGSGSGHGGAAVEDKCCVCLAGMREAQALRDLPRCGHRFHAKCIGKWLTAHPTCPVCRATAVPPPPPPATGADHADDAITPV